MSWKRSTVLFISILALLPLYELVKACADDGDYEAESTFFANDVNGKPAFRPFFYTEGPRYYDDGWYNSPADLPDANLDEWKGYTGNAVSLSDLDSFIYTGSYADLKSLYGNIEKGTPLSVAPVLASNSFTGWFQKTRDFEALGYLMYAKQCEPYTVSRNEWENPKPDTAKTARLIKNGLQLYNAAKKDLIRDKYAFQVIRLAFYSGKNEQALQLYSQLIGDRLSGGYTYARCLELKAGALFRLGRKEEAAYLYSRTFDLSDNLKKSSFVSFDWCVSMNAAPVLKYCKTPHEKAVVHVMDGLHQYDEALPVLQAAYDADPKVNGLDVVMTREINKMEQRFLRTTLYSERSFRGYAFPDPNTQADAQNEARKYTPYLESLNTFARKVAAGNKTDNPAFWLLSSSYLYFMQQNPAECKRMMEAARTAGMNTKEQDMYHTLQIIYAVRSNGKMSPALEAQLLPDLKWLRTQHEERPFHYAMATIITTAYLQAGDSVKAIYALALGSNYNATDFTDDPGQILENISIDKLHEVQAFAAKKDKTPYERWLTDSSIYTASMLYELEGTKYLRKHQFAKAVIPLEKEEPAKSLPDAFLIGIPELITWADDSSATFISKLEFAKKMAALETDLGRKPDDPALLMEFATGLYNMTYYGNANHAYTYYRSSSDELAYFNSPARQKRPQEEQEFYGAMRAEATFAKAALKATDKEERARALFMAAKCWQKRCPGKEFSPYEEEMIKAYYANCLKNPYFLQLVTSSAGTSFYKEAVGTCGYLKDYAARK